MSYRYERVLAHAAGARVDAEGRMARYFRFLFDLTPWCRGSKWPGGVPDVPDPCAFDLHFREGNKAMVYHGTTRLLTVHLVPREDRSGRPSVRFEAHPAYQAGEDVPGRLIGRRTWDPTDPGLRDVVQDYLSRKVAGNVSDRPRYYADAGATARSEGFWHNRLSIRYGQRWRSGDPWVVVDRETVIGHAEATAKKKWLQGLWGRYSKEMLDLQLAYKWAVPKAETPPDELDLLAIDGQGRLVCVELKRGCNAAGTYFGPFQAAVYRDAFARVLEEDSSGAFSQSIKDVVHQKVRLGLLPQGAAQVLPAGRFRADAVRAVLVVAEPNRKSRCWDRLAVVRARVPVEVATVETGGCKWLAAPRGGKCPADCVAFQPWP